MKGNIMNTLAQKIELSKQFGGMEDLTAKLISELTENGRSEYDRLQKNLSATVQMTDAELTAHPDSMDVLFDSPQQHPEDRRQAARELQDKLGRQGRENYAVEFAKNQVKNHTA